MRNHIQEIKIALVAVAGLVALFFGMKFLKGSNLLSSSDTYYFVFNDISGLTESSPIFAAGYQVGRIKKIYFDYSHIEKIKVLAEVDRKMKIPMGSTASISSDVLGNIKVTLNIAPHRGQYVQPGGVISGSIDTGTVGKMTEMVPTIKQILPKLDSVMFHLNALLADPALAHSIHNIDEITNNLSTSSKQLHILLTNVNREVPGIVSKTNLVLANTEQFTDNLRKIDVASTMTKVDEAMADVQEFTSKINNNSGTFGLLLKDPTLYYNLNQTMKNIDSLAVNLRQQPKRYVHFSLFGRKNK
ncbi:MlaD family protein [Hoylesella timonensis 4401737 = DSM 22865 = JCM 15640]|uniref:MlaD family protein n=1 Tax=Hoylesella timonensis TaxID=386414 RepID=UPI0003F93120|nr:MlaD family protein [Hoylesella timonensis]